MRVSRKEELSRLYAMAAAAPKAGTPELLIDQDRSNAGNTGLRSSPTAVGDTQFPSRARCHDRLGDSMPLHPSSVFVYVIIMENNSDLGTVAR